jgi:hypothetical protein
MLKHHLFLGLSIVSASLCLQGLISPCRAEIIDYHPSSSLHLGGGYDPAHATEPYTIKCIDYQTDHNIDTTGGVADAQYHLAYMTSRRDLYQTLHVSASLDAQFAFFSGGGSTTVQNDFSSSEDSITWVANVTLIFGRFQPVDPHSLAAIAGLPVDDIKSTCGTYVVTQETRGVSASIVFSFSNLSATQKSNLQTAINASASFFGAGGSVDASYQKAFEEANKSSRLLIDVVVQGGPGKEALAGVVGAGSDLAKIREALKTYITNSTEQNARPLQFSTASLTQFYPALTPSVLAAGRDDALSQMFSVYEDLNNAVTRISGLTKIPSSPEDEYLKVFVNDKQRASLGSFARLYGGAMVDISKRATKCLTDMASCVPYDISRLQRVQWPSIPPVPEVVLAKVCNPDALVPRIVAVGSPPPPDGTPVGSRLFRALIVGDRVFFDQLLAINADQSTPVAVVPIQQILAGERLDQIFGPCTNYNPDTSRAFGKFAVSFDILKNVTPKWSLELHDRFGRVSRMSLQP